MVTREIRVGRDPRCEIRLGTDCMYASSLHATLYMDGNQLMYRDMSRNGTMINNVKIHQRAIPIHPGDTIMLANQYPLGWNAITNYFPVNQGYNSGYGSCNGGTAMVSAADNTANRVEEEPDFSWNWGAFVLYPLWGFWNGCWWAIIVAFFFGWCFITNILFGAMGSKWAWNNKDWKSVEDFNEMQAAWKPWGIAIFVLNVLAWLLLVFFYSALIAALM